MHNFPQYLKEIEKEFRSGQATEHSYRPALKSLVESFSNEIEAINEPKRRTFGAPDFIVRKREIPLGYIEAKDLGKNLDKLTDREKDQLNRYRKALNNLILTNSIEFRWYVRGELVRTVNLAEKDKFAILENSEKDLFNLFNEFLHKEVPTVATPKELAERMASIARLIEIIIEAALKSDAKEGKKKESVLYGQMEGFKEVLLPDLTEEKFADLYAQTIAYGLFSARCNTQNPPFTRQKAAHNLPKTNPFLRQLFNNIAGIDLDERIIWAVDDLAELLNRSGMEAILADFGKRTRQEDPVVHFYETFLRAYDPKLRETRGVYYTPEPVVSYIVRSVDKILQKDFGMPKGLADSSKIRTRQGKNEVESHKLLILDPATGTGTFLYSVIKNIAARFEKNVGMWDGYVSEHLLPRIFGFELLVAPYAVAHLKLGLLLEETGYKFQSDERLRVYLTNTLEEADQLAHANGLTRWLSDEADAASKIKQEAPVMVVLGNPPYSGHSANTGDWMKQLLHGLDTHTDKQTEDYFKVDGKPLGERNPKWLNNDYVKFIRFSQWRIEQTGYGVLGFITSNSYLDSPTFRGMRQALMNTFDEIYILDLHGNSKKKEKALDGTIDQNVFDITEGVSIGIFVKKQDQQTDLCKVFRSELYGSREVWTQSANDEKELTGGKYQWLWQNDISSTDWSELNPVSPFYLFIPQDARLSDEFESGWKITEMIPLNNVGIVTSRDNLVFDFDEKTLRTRIRDFCDLSKSDNEINTTYLSKKDKLDLMDVRRKLSIDNNKISESFVKCLYRPFDIRHLFYNDIVIERSRREVMNNLKYDGNLALTIGRAGQVVGEGEWNLLLVTKHATEFNLYRRGGNNVFPLYIYPTEKEKMLGAVDRLPNFSNDFIEEFSKILGLKFEPENVFNYTYAVFHSPTYRSRYSEFLKIDFPRLPLTSNVELFRELVKLGNELVKLHLMEKEIESKVTFPERGSNEVEFVKYSDEKVWINKTQYFDHIREEIWEFHIGGYRVADKWLKDRKGRTLSFDDLEHYRKIIATLGLTMELMQQIDDAIEENGGFPIS